MTTAIWWIRRDLRLDDNPALHAATTNADRVIPLFILDSRLWSSTNVSEARKAFLLANLRVLQKSLEDLGSHLILRSGDPIKVMPGLLEESGADLVFAQDDGTPYARWRDQRIQPSAPLKLTEGLMVHPIGSVLKADGNPYTVFTPYSRAWRAMPSPADQERYPAPEKLNTPRELHSEALPVEPGQQDQNRFPPGEDAAIQRLDDFVTGASPTIFRYDEDRNRPDIPGTSGLSPYLHLGVLSPRRAAAAALMAIESAPDEPSRKSADTWLNELIWREFFIDILHHFPQVHHTSFREDLREMDWSNDGNDFAAWKEGRTGYPIVDAAMRELIETSWMHNRARMITASFLVKDLLIDWRWGERWFLQNLIDGDPAANNGGWQWSAGTGTDAAPYFRVFNPVLQGKKFDPDGVYVRRWLPVLEKIPSRYLHEPWKMSEELQSETGCRIGVDYQAPLVDHSWARERALAAFKSTRERYSADSQNNE